MTLREKSHKPKGKVDMKRKRSTPSKRRPDFISGDKTILMDKTKLKNVYRQSIGRVVESKTLSNIEKVYKVHSQITVQELVDNRVRDPALLSAIGLAKHKTLTPINTNHRLHSRQLNTELTKLYESTSNS